MGLWVIFDTLMHAICNNNVCQNIAISMYSVIPVKSYNAQYIVTDTISITRTR